ncbi:hypothetical protein [Asticcacaulis sp.]|uniref:hypothetical protein n=1 Tax=Asticcacaulis sp. TaxID=1872648 RepID=UPI003F7C36D9
MSDIRYYVNVTTDELRPIPAGSADLLNQTIKDNLDEFRVNSGFDYRSFSVKGMNSTAAAHEIYDEVVVEQGDESQFIRLIISQDRPGGTQLNNLALGVCHGDTATWECGDGDNFGVLTMPNLKGAGRQNAIVDILQDIRIANGATIAPIFQKYLAAGGSEKALYELKAEFAKTFYAANPGRSHFAVFTPRAYASFSALSRLDENKNLSDNEMATLESLWNDFICERLSNYFLTAAETVDLITRAYIRNTANGKRRRLGSVARSKILALITDALTVTADGPYVFCYVNRSLTGSGKFFNQLSRHFGLSSHGRLLPYGLFSLKDYKALTTLVRNGAVTPIRLFLKKP